MRLSTQNQLGVVSNLCRNGNIRILENNIRLNAMRPKQEAEGEAIIMMASDEDAISLTSLPDRRALRIAFLFSRRHIG
jgi:hypothetical protein